MADCDRGKRAGDRNRGAALEKVGEGASMLLSNKEAKLGFGISGAGERGVVAVVAEGEDLAGGGAVVRDSMERALAGDTEVGGEFRDQRVAPRISSDGNPAPPPIRRSLVRTSRGIPRNL